MTFSADEDFALQQDACDPLRSFRERFHIPRTPDGEPVIYFVGNSLGLMPKTTRAVVEQELEDWANLGVDGHLEGQTPWYSYHETVRDSAARIVGAQPPRWSA
jgi:kynureninase